MVGSILSILDILFPGVLIPVVAVGMRMMGLMMIGLGIFLLIGREVQTGADKLTMISKPHELIVCHQRKSGKSFFLKGEFAPLEHIVAKYRKDWMIFKDTGGHRDIAKHYVVFTNETVSYTIPETIAEWVYQQKQKFGVKNLNSLKALHDNLKSVHVHEDLYNIDELREILDDPEKKKILWDMSVEDVRNMRELLYDGQITHFDGFEEFEESAAPYDMESYTNKKITQRIWQYKNYQPMSGMGDIMKWVLAIVVLFIGGGIAYQIFFGG